MTKIIDQGQRPLKDEQRHGELPDSELNKVTGGGKVMHGDLQCQKYLDKASIIL